MTRLVLFLVVVVIGCIVNHILTETIGVSIATDIAIDQVNGDAEAVRALGSVQSLVSNSIFAAIVLLAVLIKPWTILCKKGK